MKSDKSDVIDQSIFGYLDVGAHDEEFVIKESAGGEDYNQQ